MNHSIVKSSTLAIALGSILALGACSVEKTEEGEMPTVDVETTGGELPAYDVETADVSVGSKETTVTVPEVDITSRETQVTVPDVDVTMPSDKDESQAPETR